jgi:colicin import membrane protein
MTDSRTDRVVSIALSVVIHAAILAALLWGWWHYRTPAPTAQSLAIEGTVVSNSSPAPPEPAPPKPVVPSVPAPPPQPTPEEQAAQQASEQRAAQKRAEEEATAQQRQREEAQKAAAEKAAADKTAAEKAAADKAVADKAAADLKADEAHKAELARQAKADADKKAQERTQREADLRSQLAAEEHLNAVQSSPAKAEYLSLITARINHAWIRPPSARSGVKCTVHITQVPGGVITHVSVTGCNGDESVRQSVETAAYRASPLPAPSDPALFDPNIDVTFAPDE